MTRQLFGTRQPLPTIRQMHARRAALGFFILAALSLGASFGVDREGLAVLLVVLAFVSLAAGMAAAGEA
jgi:hypothetical protein